MVWAFEELSVDNQGAVRELILAGLEEHWGSLDPTLNADLNDMVTSYAAGQTIVASEDGRVIGTGTLQPFEADDGSGVEPGTAEIVRMSVDGRIRRRGLGRAIVAELERRARDAGYVMVRLETTTDWVEVVAFYQSCGYAVTHTEDGEFGSGTWFSKAL